MDLIRYSLQSAFDRTLSALCVAITLCGVPSTTNAAGNTWQGNRNRSNEITVKAGTMLQIRAAAGMTEDRDSTIKELNTQALAKRRQILLVEQFPGSGQCLAIHVIQNDSSRFRQIWMLDREPLGGGGLCMVLTRSPKVRVGIAGEILLQIPSSYINMPKRIEEYAYAWNGHSYSLIRHHSIDE